MEMEKHHFSHHDHPLMFTEELKYNVDERVWCCDGCDTPILPGNPLYSCSLHGCEFKLHKVCAELPREIKAPELHPNHILTLRSEPYYSPSFTCKDCGRSWKKFTYYCESRFCNFELDPFCAVPSIMRQFLQFKHPCHQHPLTPLLRPALFICTGCDTKLNEEVLSYSCTVCDQSWIHRDCAFLPTTIRRPDLHVDHPLILAFSIPDKYLTFKIFCNICFSYMPKDRWLYYCGRCRYFAHLKCVIWNREPSDWGQETGNGRKVEVIEESELICLPVADESSWITNHFSKKMIIEDTKTTKHDDDKIINHFSHQDHPLILFNDPDKEESSFKHHKKNATTASTSTSGDRRFCSGCLQTISKSTYYGCIPCDYFIHEDCAFLPSEVQQHPLHPKHPLVLLPQGPRFLGSFMCQCCERWCNGFTYGCNTCKYYLDLKCASLPTAITHKAHLRNHPHGLVLRENEDFEYDCDACSYGVQLQYMYKCEGCNFKIDMFCAQLPQTIEHRYDKHPLVLNYCPLKDHPEEYFCEICEKELNPQMWFYHCTECDQSIHPACYFDQDENLKYGGTINVNRHPHPLTFAKPEWESECDSCGESIQIFWHAGIFECMRCVKYKMHWYCAESWFTRK